MRPQLSPEATRLLYGVSVMQHGRDPAEQMKIAERLGIAEAVVKMRQPVPRPSYLYVMDTETPVGQYFKIGRSVQPAVRLKQVQSGKGAAMPPGWDGHSVELKAIREGGPALEASIHHDLREHRIQGTEWFLASMAIAQYLVDQDAWDIWEGQA